MLDARDAVTVEPKDLALAFCGEGEYMLFIPHVPGLRLNDVSLRALAAMLVRALESGHKGAVAEAEARK